MMKFKECKCPKIFYLLMGFNLQYELLFPMIYIPIYLTALLLCSYKDCPCFDSMMYVVVNLLLNIDAILAGKES